MIYFNGSLPAPLLHVQLIVTSCLFIIYSFWIYGCFMLSLPLLHVQLIVASCWIYSCFMLSLPLLHVEFIVASCWVYHCFMFNLSFNIQTPKHGTQLSTIVMIIFFNVSLYVNNKNKVLLNFSKMVVSSIQIMVLSWVPLDALTLSAWKLSDL